MNTKYIVIVVAAALFAGLAFYVWNSGAPLAEQARQLLQLEQDAAPVTLSADEEKALMDAGFAPASTGADGETDALQSVYTSDELDIIGSDIDGTDLSGLDAEADQITSDASGL